MEFPLLVSPFGRLTRPAFAWSLGIVVALVLLLMGQIPGRLLARGWWLLYIPLYWTMLCLVVQRLHDADRSGAWAAVVIVPLLGPLVLLVMLGRPSSLGTNRFGVDPGARSYYPGRGR